MHDPVLIEIPYWYDAKVIRRRCRVEDDVLLRTTVPYQMPHLSAAEATPALTVEILFVYDDQRHKPPFHQTWLSDGVSYLRPLQVHLGDAPTHDFDYRSASIPMTLDHLRAILTFQGGQIEFDRNEFPQRWLFDRNPKFRGVKFKGRRVDHIVPTEVDTPADYTRVVKRWISSDEDLGSAIALRDAQRYVLVDGIVHRRVPAPFWVFSSIPSLGHGETLIGNDSTLMWSIALTDDFNNFLASQPHYHHRMEAEAEYHQSPDLKADLARLGSLALAGLGTQISQAIPYLSDENLDRYKILRHASKTASMSFDDCSTAMAMLEAMLPDRGWDTAMKYPSNNLRRPVTRQVIHWKRLLHAAGASILNITEDEALASLSI